MLQSAGPEDGLTIAPRSVTVFQEVVLAAETRSVGADVSSLGAKFPLVSDGTAGTSGGNGLLPGLSVAGDSDADLDRLADLAGINPIWWDVDGGYHKVGADTKRALLAAMRLPAATPWRLQRQPGAPHDRTRNCRRR